MKTLNLINSFQKVTNDLQILMDRLKLKKLHYTWSFWGGMLAMNFAAELQKM